MRIVMNNINMNRGIALLITMLLTSVLLGVATSLLNISLKQYQLAGIARDSEVAFQAASSGSECIQYYDNVADADDNPVNGRQSIFDVPGDGSNQTVAASASCMGAAPSVNSAPVASGEEQRFSFTWGTPEVCSVVSIYKYYNENGDEAIPAIVTGNTPSQCDQGVTCTIVKARGYNMGCTATAKNKLEREITIRY